MLKADPQALESLRESAETDLATIQELTPYSGKIHKYIEALAKRLESRFYVNDEFLRVDEGNYKPVRIFEIGLVGTNQITLSFGNHFNTGFMCIISSVIPTDEHQVREFQVNDMDTLLEIIPSLIDPNYIRDNFRINDLDYDIEDVDFEI